MSSVRPLTARRWLPITLLAVAGCTPGATSSDESADRSATEQAPATVTIPQVRLTPFCQAMIDLSDRLENDPPADVEATIIETYEGIEDEVPAEIREDFDAVLADLRGDAATTSPDPDAPTTTRSTGADGAVPPATDETGATLPSGDPFFDEGYEPADDPATRLSAYVDFECRDVANNPGPPPTQPLSDVTTTEP